MQKHDCAKARRHSLIFGVRDKSKKQNKLLPELETGSFKIEQKSRRAEDKGERRHALGEHCRHGIADPVSALERGKDGTAPSSKERERKVIRRSNSTQIMFLPIKTPGIVSMLCNRTEKMTVVRREEKVPRRRD
jgi:hypothetical protein